MTATSGWYDDGVTPGVQRWFDGEQWTAHTRPVPEIALLATWGPTVSLAPPPEPGPWGLRVRAAIVDHVLVLTPVAAGAIWTVLDGSAGVDTSGRRVWVTTPVAASALVVGLLLTVLLWLLNRVARQGRTGRSWGKQALGLRLVEEGRQRPVGAWWAFVRDVACVVNVVPLLLGYLWPLRGGRRQTFTDQLCHAVVVHEPR